MFYDTNEIAMLTSWRGIDIVAIQRPRNTTEASPQYEQKFGVIALPEYKEPRNLDILPNIAILRTNHPKTQILKNTQWSLAHVFMTSDILDQRWLGDDFWSLYIWATTNADFYTHNKEKQWVVFILKYMQAISQTALKSEIIRQKMVISLSKVQERGDDFDLIWLNELQERFVKKLSDEWIYTQYNKMTKNITCLEELSQKLVDAMAKQWKDIDFWPKGLEQRSVYDPNKLCLN